LSSFLFSNFLKNVSALLPCHAGMIIDPNEKSASKKIPKLKAKAHETALTVFALSKIWKKKMKENDKVHQWINYCLVNSCRVDEILRNRKDEWKIPATEAGELESAALKMVVCNFALCQHFAAEGKCLFQANTFKHHWLLHAVKLAKYINPKHVDCYSGESFMSTMKTLMHAQLRGRRSLSSMTSVMERYVMALTFETVNANDRKTWKLK